jgi:hypothetical protein
MTADSELQMANSKSQIADSELQMADSKLQIADGELQMADSGEPSAINHSPSAISDTPFAISHQPFAIIAFCCHYCAYAAADLAGSLRVQYPQSVKVVKLPCTGKLDVQLVLEAFERGADGVMVAG